ncbi:MAG: PolC-type DNA polymerase III [Clostridiales bacterium]|uniref:PolC-type DNA polymerase III n=1 Tax=Hornefia butyriciproducens TaxID=2652293 RepID=UPI002A764056|nr:PolC-type DNA polymerase III [Hornefia butyriciproducens]MCI7679928.1 PolC-type DNA polymerase III [Clostridiales bacterium]MDY2989937.1 PolC-type DNA polymerase III [Hornefia butyriciproducens]
MNSLFENSINWERFSGTDREQIRCEIEDAFVHGEDYGLNVRIGLNFVMSAEEQKKVKDLLAMAVPDALSVNVYYDYDWENLATDRMTALRDLIPILIERCDSSMTNAVRADSIEIDEDCIRIGALGRIATDHLNSCAARELEGEVRRAMNRQYRVLFYNDEESYDEAEKALEQHARREMKEHAARSEKAVKAVKSAPAPRAFTLEKKTDRRRGGRMLLTKNLGGTVTPLKDLQADTGRVTVAGTIFHVDTRPVRNDKSLIMLLVTDKEFSAKLKFFIKNDEWEEIGNKLKAGTYITAAGETEWNRWDHSLDVMVRAIEIGEAPRRQDNYPGKKRVELHAHTKMSDMDGLNDVDKLVKTAADWGQPAVAITDHGVVQGYPDALKAANNCTENGNPIRVIFGMEGYVFEDRNRIDEDGNIDYKGTKQDPVRTSHIILLVKTQAGMKNMYKLVSTSHINYFYRRPRLPRSVIQKYREGIILGSACEAGEVYRAVREGLPEAELEKIASFYDYLEIQPLINDKFMISDDRYPQVSDWEDLRNINRRIVALGEKLGKPVVATTDAHYDEPESAIYRNIIMKGKGFKDAENGEGLYLRTTEEMLEEFSYLGEEKAYEVVVENSNRIAEMIDSDILPVPKEKCPPKIEGAEETLRTTCMSRAHEIYGDPLPEPIQERLDTELNAIIKNGYAVMYVSAQMLVKKSLEDGYLVGSRGSVGSSLAATMAGITEVNPLNPHYICPECKHLEWGDMDLYDCGIDMPEKNCPKCGTVMRRDGFTIPFATFLGFKGDKEPDIDLNFASEYQPRAHRYVGEIFGEKNVFKAGTVGTIAEKTAKGFVRKFAEETNREITEVEIDRLAAGCEGVKRTTGQHPGGIVIVPDDREIYEFCPVQRPANDSKSDITTTHFDYHKIDQNLLKLDILGHNIPSMIRQLQDMTGVDPLSVDLSDRKVLSLFNGTEALDIKDPDYRFTHGSYAIPEFGTSFVRQMLDDAKPDKFADLVRISGFSHGTDVWLNNAQDYIRQGVATMREVISTRDDIMNYLILKGIENETSFKIMEDVRKNRPLKPEQLKVMKEHGVPDWYIDSCIKIQYMFPRAHAVAYVMMSFRMAWYKVYYPPEFYATVFSSDVTNFNADVILRGKQAVLDRMDEIDRMGNNASAKEKDEKLVLEIAYEMYARGYKFRNARLGASRALKFWVEDGEVLLPYAAFSGVGETAARSLADAYKEKPFDTIEEAMNRAKISRAVVDVLKEHGVFGDLPETDQLSWAL